MEYDQLCLDVGRISRNQWSWEKGRDGKQLQGEHLMDSANHSEVVCKPISNVEIYD